jgi:hypothetical protein
MPEDSAGAISSHEDTIGRHLLAEATLAAHLVAIAEAAGLSHDEINAHLRNIAERTGLEFWVTDEKGRAYLRNRLELQFRFSPDPAVQPQASAFWPVLTGERDEFVQDARVRGIDERVFKYAAVSGIDRPRIVQVGVEV